MCARASKFAYSAHYNALRFAKARIEIAFVIMSDITSCVFQRYTHNGNIKHFIFTSTPTDCFLHFLLSIITYITNIKHTLHNRILISLVFFGLMVSADIDERIRNTKNTCAHARSLIWFVRSSDALARAFKSISMPININDAEI